MAKVKRSVLVLAAASLLFCLCRVSTAAASDAHIVTRVDVLYRGEQEVLQRQYTRQDSMQAILNYLRLTAYAGMPDDDPELHRGTDCRITVQLSGGGRRVYYLHADRYLSRDHRPWEKIIPPQPLLALLQSLQTDM